MDSRIFNIAFSRALQTVSWNRHGEHEYVLVGDGTLFDKEKLQRLVDATFNQSTLWLSKNRHEAVSFARSRAADEIVRLMPKQGTLTLSDSDVHQFLQVQCMGVARTGVAQANYAFKRTAGRDFRVS